MKFYIFDLLYKLAIKFSSLLRHGVNIFMPKKLSPEEAQRIVKKFCKPPYDPDEAKLKEAMWVIMKEG